MSQQLTLVLSDATYANVERAARAAGQTPTEWLLTYLERQFPANGQTQPVEQPKVMSVESFFGAIDSGDLDSANNKRIDADLAREYGRGL
jgi:hypothetical protein